MVLITITEILSMIVVTLVIGFIFLDMLILPRKKIDILDRYKNNKKYIFKGLLFASLITAPGIILHELAHKFSAIALGYSAIFKMWILGLGLAVLLKLIHSPFLIIAPGYVEIAGSNPNSTLDMVLISFAGPLINLILWIIPLILLKTRNFSRKWTLILLVTKRINIILFIFNMLPIPPLDGSKVFFGLYQLLTA